MASEYTRILTEHNWHTQVGKKISHLRSDAFWRKYTLCGFLMEACNCKQAEQMEGGWLPGAEDTLRTETMPYSRAHANLTRGLLPGFHPSDIGEMQPCAAWKWNVHGRILSIPPNRLGPWIGNKIALSQNSHFFPSAYFWKLKVKFELTRKKCWESIHPGRFRLGKGLYLSSTQKQVSGYWSP